MKYKPTIIEAIEIIVIPGTRNIDIARRHVQHTNCNQLPEAYLCSICYLSIHADKLQWSR
jgi:hypothetical protein